jgi:hypothetical protein
LAAKENVMPETMSLDKDQLRLLIAMQYLTASNFIFAGLERQHKENKFHFVISLRSFIEYTRRGTWFLCWANQEQLKVARKMTFERPGSPNLVKMDEMIGRALGKGGVSPLSTKLPGINESMINCLHALTHGNPISVRMITFGLDKIFDVEMLLLRAKADLGIFRILLYRKALGENQKDIWKRLSGIHNRPHEIEACLKESVVLLKSSGKAENILNSK